MTTLRVFYIEMLYIDVFEPSVSNMVYSIR